ncbi:MAG: hypothetical protein RIC35_01930 [Marinoscillum sp.]
MKLIPLLLTAILSIALLDTATAQYEEDYASPDLYLDLSSGIDNHTGILGIGAMFPFNKKMALRAGAGIGAWGGKLSAGIKFEDRETNGWGFGLSYSHCPGLEDMDITFTDASGGSRVVNLDLLQVGSINFTINRNWVFRNKNIFFLETGYAAQTGRKDCYQVNDGSTLTPEEDLLMQILRPGGLILALGIRIGL